MMSPLYDWKNTETGERVETDSCDVPPDESGEWVRDYSSVSIGAVKGAGGSPFKSAAKRK